MICKKCGAEVPDNSKFCRNCGEPQVNPFNPNPNPAPNPGPNNSQEQNPFNPNPNPNPNPVPNPGPNNSQGQNPFNPNPNPNPYQQRQNPYNPNNPFGQDPAQKKAQDFALWSLICGIISMFCCGIIAGPLAIVFGVKAKNSGSTSGMATAGIVLGIIALALMVLSFVFSFFAAFSY